jgi:hypothetical protein
MEHSYSLSPCIPPSPPSPSSPLSSSPSPSAPAEAPPTEPPNRGSGKSLARECRSVTVTCFVGWMAAMSDANSVCRGC